ncbi:MAG TPA: type VI secretion system tube protein Hcp [Xanthobacteraceae bacterium]|jgi:type VI secretion system secreted protein Hcp|nr:type VI secretion system tube protein Hcp [Xanthobacteraceae bacterium]
MAVSDYHLEFKGPKLEGESQDEEFKDCIQIDSWSWTGTNASTHNVGQGGGAGKVLHGDLQCQKWLDKASIVLFDKLNCGDHFQEAILHCRKKQGNEGKALEFLKITMKHVTVSNVSLGGHSNATAISESISLSYEEVKFEYTMQKPDGSKGAVSQAGWHLGKNKRAA